MRTLFALILLLALPVKAAVTPAVQNDQTTKHVVQPPGFWPAQITDSAAVAFVRAAQTNGAGGGGGGAVDSVNGQSGVVVLTTTHIAEALNLYWTATRSNNLWLAIKPAFQPATANGTNWSLLSTNVIQTVAAAAVASGAVTSIGGFQGALNSLNVASSGSASAFQVRANEFIGSGSQLTSLPESMLITNYVVDLRTSQRLQMKGPNGGDGYIWGWGLNVSNDRLVLSNTVFSNQIEFNNGIQGRQGGTVTWNLGTSTGSGTFTGTVAANLFSGSGASLTAVPAAQLTGTMPATVFPAAVSNQINLNATNLLATGSLPAENLTGAGTLPTGVLPSSVSLLGQTIDLAAEVAGILPGSQAAFAPGTGVTFATNSGVVTIASAASGGLPFTSGTNVTLVTNTGVVTISGPVIAWGLSDATHATNTLSKGLITVEIGGVMTATSFVGSGAGLTALHAENLVNTIDDARLSANVDLLNANQTSSGAKTFTGGLTNSWMVLKFKPADQVVNTQTAMTNDTELSFAVGANEMWQAELHIRYSSTTTTPKFQFDFVGLSAQPTSCSYDVYNTRNGSFFGSTQAGFTNTIALTSGIQSSDSLVIHLMILNGSGSGTAQFRWAQQASTAENTLVKAGSNLRAWRFK